MGKPRTHESAVYICRDEIDAVIYVGQTWDWPGRRTEHRRKSSWWPTVASVLTIPADDEVARLRLERVLITILEPRHNVQHTRREAAVRLASAAKARDTSNRHKRRLPCDCWQCARPSKWAVTS